MYISLDGFDPFRIAKYDAPTTACIGMEQVRHDKEHIAGGFQQLTRKRSRYCFLQIPATWGIIVCTSEHVDTDMEPLSLDSQKIEWLPNSKPHV